MRHGDRVVIVGGSVAGVRAARALRDAGHGGSITILEAETELPYDKPPLSKGEAGERGCVRLLTPDQADELGIELRLGFRAERLDVAPRRVWLTDDTFVDYDHLVIATGLTPRRPSYDVAGIHVLRTLEDARGVRDAIDRAIRILVIGAGFIGAEVASMARASGVEVVLVDPAVVPMRRIVGEEVGRRFVELHERHGVDVRFGVTATTIVEDGDGYLVDLSDGTSLPVDAVIAGIGSEVSLDWLGDSGLPLDDGVVCDERGAVVGVDGIHAVGDAARWNGARVEHWTNAVEQADCVAHNIVHPDQTVANTAVPYVWSDQHDWNIQIVGHLDPEAEPDIVEEDAPYRLAATWRDASGTTTGAVTVNWPRESLRVRKALRHGGAA